MGLRAAMNILLLRTFAVAFSALALCACGNSVGVSNVSPAAIVDLSATGLQFGNERVGTSSSSQRVKISNSGMTDLAISNLALSSADASSFILSNGCGTTLAVHTSCTVAITFAP